MELDTKEPTAKLIPCEVCGAEAKLLCFCRKASLCENCIGRHLIAEPNLAHKPITFSQSEISAMFEKEFSQLRESEAKLLQEVTDRHEYLSQGKARLQAEIQKLESFKCTCLEYVAVAVEVTSQKLAQAAETVGKEMIEACDNTKKVLEEAVRALEAGEDHWLSDQLFLREKAVCWQGNIDLREIDLVATLRSGIDFKLTMSRPDTNKSVEKVVPAKPVRKLSQKLESTSKPKAENLKPAPVTKSTPRTAARIGYTEAKGASSGRRQAVLKVNQSLADGEQCVLKREFDYPSPEPPLALTRCTTESPGFPAYKGNLSLTSRRALLQQTAKNVNEVSDLVKALKSPRGPTPLSEWNSCAAGSESPVAKTTTHFAMSKKSDYTDEWDLKSSLQALPEVIPEETTAQRVKPCLYYFTPGESSLIIRDLDRSESTVKTFEGIEPFGKWTFWSVAPSGEVYVIGGIGNEGLPSTVKKTCLIYSPTQDTIENGPNLTTARYSCAAICVKDALFVTGGVGTDLSALKDCEKLDLKSRKWRRTGNLNIARESHGITVHLGRMYVAGAPGEQSMETYNPVNDRWALLHFKVSAGGKACVFSLGDKIAVMHEKSLTFAWVDRRTSEHVRDLEERGWWLSGLPVRSGSSVFLQRGAQVYQYCPDSCDLIRVEP